MEQDMGVAASPPGHQPFGPQPATPSSQSGVPNADVVILDRHPTWVDRWFRNRGPDTVITGERQAAMYEACGYVRRPPPVVGAAREVTARLRRFQRTLTGWTVSNSNDTNIHGAIRDAISVIDALIAASAIEAAQAGETANAGSTEGESAVPKGDAQ